MNYLACRGPAFYGVFTGLALALHVLEGAVLPSLGPPGAKLGLANLVTLLILDFSGLRAALGVTLLRVLLGTVLGGTFLAVGFWMSLAGGLGSTLLMGSVLHLCRGADLRLLGAAGAVTHNACQLAVACFFYGPGALYYLPALVLFALPAGFFTGTVARKSRSYAGFLTTGVGGGAGWQRR